MIGIVTKKIVKATKEENCLLAACMREPRNLTSLQQAEGT